MPGLMADDWIQIRQSTHTKLMQRRTEAIKLKEENEKLIAEKLEIDRQLQRLLNKVNRVTATWRHQKKVNDEDLTVLCNRQIEVEEATGRLRTRRDDTLIIIPNLILGGLYHIRARNASVGIWTKRDHPDPKYEYGFVIARTKFKHTFLDCEYHWDTCDHYGTVMPWYLIEQAPVNMDDKTKLQYLIEKEAENDRRRKGSEEEGI